MEEKNSSQTLLSQKIQESLNRATITRDRLRRLHVALTVTVLLSGAVASLLSGISAAQGQSIIGAGNSGWQITCVVISVLTFAGTLAGGIGQQFKISERLEKSQTCAGLLSALQNDISLSTLEIKDAAARYSRILSDYQVVLS